MISRTLLTFGYYSTLSDVGCTALFHAAIMGLNKEGQYSTAAGGPQIMRT